ncbi:MAG: ATP synthase subunit I, partial [Desulfobulbaceae bacterium]|nr:ATP synthase subunit I [Desulfobulbaceae bacterium]
DDVLSLQKMQSVCWIVLAGMTLGSFFVVSVSFAWSVLAGGVISNVSFLISQKDIRGFVESITSFSEPDARQAKAKQGQKGYLLKFWLRIAIIGIALLLLIKSGVVNIFGLILGLSTVVLAVMFVSLNVIRRYYFSGRR